MHDFFVLLFSFLLLISAHANVEKIIFIAPPPNPVPLESPAFDGLGLERLSSLSPALRTLLNASFPTQDAPQGAQSWFFLQGLNPGQRYEVRVCWPATQPTSFSLNTFTLSETISDSALMSSLGNFSSANRASYISINQAQTTNKRSHRLSMIPATESVLFLRIFAAADYFTLNTEMMKTVPQVTVDVILDPYLFNILPRSLVPTLGWVAVVAAVGWVAGGWIAKSLRAIMDEAEKVDHRNRTDKIEGRKKI
jgi:hypothetical protein